MSPAHARSSRIALVALFVAGCALPARADILPHSVGAAIGYGDGVDVYGVQGIWMPRLAEDRLRPLNLEWRVSGQLAQWVARGDSSKHKSLTDGSVISELRYAPWREAQVSPFIELGLGLHLISHVEIANHNLATAYHFGSQGAAGFTFGENRRYELAAFIHHASNARIKQPNQGLTYSGLRFRVALP
jgi:hypothetical protein